MTNPTGVYPTFHHVACKGCGQLTRVEVCYPVILAPKHHRARFCPMCGVAWEYEKGLENGSQFWLVARHLFGKEPTREQVDIIASMYPVWDADVHGTFREFLKATINDRSQA